MKTDEILKIVEMHKINHMNYYLTCEAYKKGLITDEDFEKSVNMYNDSKQRLSQAVNTFLGIEDEN